MRYSNGGYIGTGVYPNEYGDVDGIWRYFTDISRAVKDNNWYISTVPTNIVVSPSSVAAKVDDEITLTCSYDNDLTGFQEVFLWQKSLDQNIWNDIENSNNSQYTFTMTLNDSGTYLRCKTYRGLKSGNSNTVPVEIADLVPVEYLVIGGGGGGGAHRGPGGGAGGYVYGSGNIRLGVSVSGTIGSGGSPGLFNVPFTVSGGRGTKGGNSTLMLSTETITAIGGGYGACGLSSLSFGYKDDGGSGGSGGGGNGYPEIGIGGSSENSQGNSGGNGLGTGEPYCGGGGGGAVSAGGSSTSPANGGAGSSDKSAWLTIVGAGENIGGTRYVAGGGGAGTYDNTPGTGGNGGGGSGGNTNSNGTSGMSNTGGGGGGGGNEGSGGSGGSGLIIVRYLDSEGITSLNGPSSYVNDGYRYIKFIANGSFTLS